MALALADLQAWRDRLVESRLSGIMRVRDHNLSEVVYRSDNEMGRAIAYVESLIAAMSATPVTTIRFVTSKGL